MFMATVCKKCGGVIPDLIIGGGLSEYSDCKNHNKPEVNIKWGPKY